MIESGLYNYLRKIVYKKPFFKKEFHYDQNENIKSLNIRLILLACKLSSFLIFPAIILLIFEMILIRSSFGSSFGSSVNH